MNILLFFICMAGMREQQTHFTPAVYADAGRMQFSNGISFDIAGLGKAGSPALPPNLTFSPEQAEYFMVCLNGPIYQAQKDWLESNGFKILFPVSRYGFVGRINSRKNLDALRADPAVAWIGTYQPAYKISPLFDQVGQEYKTTMLVFMDQDLTAVLAEVKTITGLEDLEVSDNGINKIIRGVINKKHLEGLARVHGIYWLEPSLPVQFHNYNVQWVVQTAQNSNRRIWDMGITGEGQIVNALDGGINTYHYMFRTGNSPPITEFGYFPDHGKIVAYDSGGDYNIIFGDHPVYSYHGTHFCGTMCGNDSGTPGNSPYDGVARNAKLYFNDCGGNSMNGVNLFQDLNLCWERPYHRYYPPTRAHVSANGWGSPALRLYTVMSMQADQFMWGHKDFEIFFSVGNSGSGGGTVNPPATAKNVIAIGAVGNGTGYQILASFSSRGQTQDGRLKPTIMAPGNGVTSSTSGTNTFTTMTGTTMGVAAAGGSAALLREYLKKGWYPVGKKTDADSFSYISASLVKAMLINSAIKISTYNPPDSNIGWGLIVLDSVMYFNGDERKLLLADNAPGLLTGERVDYYFDVPDSAKNLKISLAWTDYPGNPAVVRQIVNDLDLTVYCDSGYYRGNQYANGQSIPNPTGRDSINVEECVRVNNPVAGSWRIAVEARNIMAGPQPFSLVVTYVGWSTSGTVALDKPVYKANDFGADTVRIRVEDANYGSASVVDSLMVDVYSILTEPQRETVWCHELAESSYVFKGDIPLLFNKPVHGDDRVSVYQGDSVYVWYQDEDPVIAVSAKAWIDAEYFTISDVRCDTISSNFANVGWRTSENANQTVFYGTSPSNLDQTVTVDTPYVFQHRVTLRSLIPETTYYYDVESRDFRGNRVRDDNNGFHYSFTTNRMTGIDILVVFADGATKATLQGLALPDIRNRFRKAVEQGRWTYTWWETSDHLGDLPSLTIMDNYKALFMPNEDEYPPFLTSQMESVLVYEEAGGRIAFSSHDLMWWCWDSAGSGNPNVAVESLWCKNYLHARYKGDIMATGNFRIYGIAGDSMTGPYTSGITYSPHRSGADGDTVVGIAQPPNSWDTGGVSSDIWRWNAVAGNIVGCKWESGQTHGAPGQGIWGGYKTRTVLNAFSVTQLDTLILPDILNREFIWLIGHDHPDVWITSPVAGQTYIASPISISWYDSAYGGTQIDSTRIEYSPDAGQTWILIASGVDLISPYDWDISGLTNGARFRIRIWLNDQYIYPSLSGMDETGNFTIRIPGNDHIGPRIIPQSIYVSRNPVVVSPADTLVEIRAVASDSLSGLSVVSGVTWSFGYYPAPPGSGGLMRPGDGVYDSVTESVFDTLKFVYTPGTEQVCTLWVRARDSVSAGVKNWGNAQMRTLTVIDGLPVLVGANDQGTTMPMQFAFMSPSPNPFRRHIALDYALPIPCRVELTIYNCLGQSVRILEQSAAQPGFYRRFWDGRDDLGRFVPAGVYFSRFSAGDFIQTRKMVLIR